MDYGSLKQHARSRLLQCDSLFLHICSQIQSGCGRLTAAAYIQPSKLGSLCDISVARVLTEKTDEALPSNSLTACRRPFKSVLALGRALALAIQQAAIHLPVMRLACNREEKKTQKERLRSNNPHETSHTETQTYRYGNPGFLNRMLRIIIMIQNLRKHTFGAKLENHFFSKNDLHTPENDTTYFFYRFGIVLVRVTMQI